ncbi:MAG: arginine repressor [Bacillota bacterium]|nr:arginine repressor [Bacillota bacterium]
MKYIRQAKISELISMYEIETQQDLANKLKEAGVEVTQATISRDIKDMRLIKVLSDSGKYKYANMGDNFSQITNRFVNVLKETVIKINNARNIVIVHTIEGAAGVTGSAIDSLNHDRILATLSGDNAVLVIVEDDEYVPNVIDSLKTLIFK